MLKRHHENPDSIFKIIEGFAEIHRKDWDLDGFWIKLVVEKKVYYYGSFEEFSKDLDIDISSEKGVEKKKEKMEILLLLLEDNMLYNLKKLGSSIKMKNLKKNGKQVFEFEDREEGGGEFEDQQNGDNEEDIKKETIRSSRQSVHKRKSKPKTSGASLISAKSRENIGSFRESSTKKQTSGKLGSFQIKDKTLIQKTSQNSQTLNANLSKKSQKSKIENFEEKDEENNFIQKDSITVKIDKGQKEAYVKNKKVFANTDKIAKLSIGKESQFKDQHLEKNVIEDKKLVQFKQRKTGTFEHQFSEADSKNTGSRSPRDRSRTSFKHDDSISPKANKSVDKKYLGKKELIINPLEKKEKSQNINTIIIPSKNSSLEDDKDSKIRQRSLSDMKNMLDFSKESVKKNDSREIINKNSEINNNIDKLSRHFTNERFFFEENQHEDQNLGINGNNYRNSVPNSQQLGDSLYLKTPKTSEFVIEPSKTQTIIKKDELLQNSDALKIKKDQNDELEKNKSSKLSKNEVKTIQKVSNEHDQKKLDINKKSENRSSKHNSQFSHQSDRKISSISGTSQIKSSETQLLKISESQKHKNTKNFDDKKKSSSNIQGIKKSITQSKILESDQIDFENDITKLKKETKKDQLLEKSLSKISNDYNFKNSAFDTIEKLELHSKNAERSPDKSRSIQDLVTENKALLEKLAQLEKASGNILENEKIRKSKQFDIENHRQSIQEKITRESISKQNDLIISQKNKILNQNYSLENSKELIEQNIFNNNNQNFDIDAKNEDQYKDSKKSLSRDRNIIESNISNASKYGNNSFLMKESLVQKKIDSIYQDIMKNDELNFSKTEDFEKERQKLKLEQSKKSSTYKIEPIDFSKRKVEEKTAQNFKNSIEKNNISTIEQSNLIQKSKITFSKKLHSIYQQLAVENISEIVKKSTFKQNSIQSSLNLKKSSVSSKLKAKNKKTSIKKTLKNDILINKSNKSLVDKNLKHLIYKISSTLNHENAKTKTISEKTHARNNNLSQEFTKKNSIEKIDLILQKIKNEENTSLVNKTSKTGSKIDILNVNQKNLQTSEIKNDINPIKITDKKITIQNQELVQITSDKKIQERSSQRNVQDSIKKNSYIDEKVDISFSKPNNQFESKKTNLQSKESNVDDLIANLQINTTENSILFLDPENFASENNKKFSKKIKDSKHENLTSQRNKDTENLEEQKLIEVRSSKFKNSGMLNDNFGDINLNTNENSIREFHFDGSNNKPSKSNQKLPLNQQNNTNDHLKKISINSESENITNDKKISLKDFEDKKSQKVNFYPSIEKIEDKNNFKDQLSNKIDPILTNIDFNTQINSISDKFGDSDVFTKNKVKNQNLSANRNLDQEKHNSKFEQPTLEENKMFVQSNGDAVQGKTMVNSLEMSSKKLEKMKDSNLVQNKNVLSSEKDAFEATYKKSLLNSSLEKNIENSDGLEKLVSIQHLLDPKKTNSLKQNQVNQNELKNDQIGTSKTSNQNLKGSFDKIQTQPQKNNDILSNKHELKQTITNTNEYIGLKQFGKEDSSKNSLNVDQITKLSDQKPHAIADLRDSRQNLIHDFSNLKHQTMQNSIVDFTPSTNLKTQANINQKTTLDKNISQKNNLNSQSENNKSSKVQKESTQNISLNNYDEQMNILTNELFNSKMTFDPRLTSLKTHTLQNSLGDFETIDPNYVSFKKSKKKENEESKNMEKINLSKASPRDLSTNQIEHYTQTSDLSNLKNVFPILEEQPIHLQSSIMMKDKMMNQLIVETNKNSIVDFDLPENNEFFKKSPQKSPKNALNKTTNEKLKDFKASIASEKSSFDNILTDEFKVQNEIRNLTQRASELIIQPVFLITSGTNFDKNYSAIKFNTHLNSIKQMDVQFEENNKSGLQQKLNKISSGKTIEHEHNSKNAYNQKSNLKNEKNLIVENKKYEPETTTHNLLNSQMNPNSNFTGINAKSDVNSIESKTFSNRSSGIYSNGPKSEKGDIQIGTKMISSQGDDESHLNSMVKNTLKNSLLLNDSKTIGKHKNVFENASIIVEEDDHSEIFDPKSDSKSTNKNLPILENENELKHFRDTFSEEVVSKNSVNQNNASPIKFNNQAKDSLSSQNDQKSSRPGVKISGEGRNIESSGLPFINTETYEAISFSKTAQKQKDSLKMSVFRENSLSPSSQKLNERKLIEGLSKVYKWSPSRNGTTSWLDF